MPSPLAATLAGIREALSSAPPQPLGPDERLDGRTVLITGGNRGLGRGIAARLGERGATLILALRAPDDPVVDALRAETGAEVRAVRLDLEDLSSPPALVDALATTRLDRVVLNAGMVSLGAQRSPAGLDRMFHVNCLGHAQLVEGLLAAGRFAQGARLVVVSSEAHRSGTIDLSRLGVAGDYGVSETMDHYGTSKLALTVWAWALSSAVPADQLGVFALCPGAVDSDIARQAPGWLRVLLKPVMRGFFAAPREAALPVAWLASSRSLDGVTGHYQHRTTVKPPADPVLDPDTQRAVRGALLDLLGPLRG